MKKLMLSFCLLLSGIALMAQNGYKIECKLNKVNAKEIYMAYHLGSKQYLKDTAQLVNGSYIFEGEEALESGVYLIAVPPKNTYFELLIDKNNQQFSVETEGPDFNLHMKIEGSEDNRIFYDYIQHLGEHRKKAQAIQENMQKPEASEAQMGAYGKELEEINQKVEVLQKEVMGKEGNFFVSKLVAANQEIRIPEAPADLDSSEQVKYRYRYYKDHYFDKLDLGDDRMLRTPVLERKVLTYLDKMVAPVPDSINNELDGLLAVAKAGGATEVHRFLLSTFLNKYAGSKVMGLDAVYVHLALKYYQYPDITPWLDEEARKEIVSNARKLEPLLIGKKAPDLDLTTLGGKKTNLYSIDSKFTAVYFWDPDCGNCSKMSTKLVEVYKEYQSKGLEIFGICNKTYEELAKCNEKEEEKGMNWINTADPYGQGQAHSKYFIRANPTIYLLDENKEIIFKRIDADQLRDILERELADKS